MRLGCGHPMGPLTLLDFVGLDTTYYIANIMFDEFREKRFAPPPLLKRMVQAGLHGRKTGKGFYDYSQEPPRPSRAWSEERMSYQNLLVETRTEWPSSPSTAPTS